MKENLNELDDTLVDIFALGTLMANKYFSVYNDAEHHYGKLPKYDMKSNVWAARSEDSEKGFVVVNHESLFDKVLSALKILAAAHLQFKMRPIDFTTLDSDDGLKKAIDKAMENWHEIH